MQEYYVNKNNQYFKVIKIGTEEIEEEITQDEFYILYNC